MGLWVTCGVKMMRLCHVWGWQLPQTASHIHIRHMQSVWAYWYAVHWHTVAALHSFTHSNRLRFGVLGHLWLSSQNLSLCHVWGWQLTQTASPSHLRHIESVWAHCCAVHRHRVAALTVIHPTWLRVWGSGSFVESKWCHYIMVEADSNLKLLPASIIDITKCLSTLICYP